MKPTLLLSSLVLSLAWTSMAFAAYDPMRALSAGYILNACKEKPEASRWLQGSCIGQIETLYLLAFSSDLADKSKFCPPDGVTIDQARQVVIKYIDDRPQLLHAPFLLLAINALKGAWPCK